ncbi:MULTISPECIES: TetR/AcrR family transcriptional regulator [unclassified Halomonas]|uniref:TetR/AcrR family transcriptional regulator n=1 Tax=unclassified Halomonas TaxID=2609666 RepID=UPI000AFCF64B|nr:TetR/AcrR family transcriptional regulator [Halomonas sp. ALS9]MBT2785287.1 TetR/AcrR family transcriptional regulator [Halomonas sp. ISL-106]MBT2799308.1 TetR/AcrR family transcriptional regulator [Halomonas sp. ISL-104]
MSQSGPEDQQASAMRPVRADAKRSIDAILAASLEVFATTGVEAPVREIALRAGIGVGTLYRHFPQRSDLIVAVFRQQVDACAESAPQLAAQYAPADALAHWMQRYTDFIVTKRGLASALHSGDPAYSALPAYFDAKLRPALQSLLDAAVAAGQVRGDIDPDQLLRAVGNLCLSAQEDRIDYARRMVTLLVDGMRYGA